jgi:hypothetical protein
MQHFPNAALFVEKVKKPLSLSLLSCSAPLTAIDKCYQPISASPADTTLVVAQAIEDAKIVCSVG